MILRIAAVALAFLVAAVALFPLRMAWSAASPGAGLSVASVDGTIWAGRVTGVVWRGQALGDFDTSLSLADLLPQPAVRLVNGTGALETALLRASNGTLTVSDADVRLPLAALAPQLNTEGIVRISDASFAMRGEACTAASGRIDTPAVPALSLPATAGALACDNGALLARLSSDAGDAVLALEDLSAAGISWSSASAPLAVILVGLGIPQSAPAAAAVGERRN